MDESTKRMVEKMKQGMVPIDAKDINGRPLHLNEALYCEGYCSLIIWSMFNEDYVAMNEEGGWLNREDMPNGEYVIFNGEDDWNDVQTTISKLDEKAAESVTRMMVSHYNMDALLNEAVRALRDIAEFTEDQKTSKMAHQHIEKIRGLIKGEA
ncbi:hypothetical protein [Paenibacillus donghaensis]|uniref:Uncharacterized protein n=1 Tax=Paenibacillus donghaensis TaxID=414771 RepID=A0A2Z2KP88_9BACL|nr:hypothetical protein [Paenibacillus donghaensis]ASA22021.1 hypothetical protein B9T62_15305 [Paenibacillus donghaensis]